MQAQGKPVTAAEWCAKAQFSEIVVSEDDHAAAAAIAPLEQNTVSGSRAEITLPRDYPVSDLVQIIRVLEATNPAGVAS